MWRLEPEGEAEKPEATGQWSGVTGVSVNPEGESWHGQARAKNGKEGKRESNKKWKRWYIGRHPVTKVRRFRVRKGKLFGWI